MTPGVGCRDPSRRPSTRIRSSWSESPIARQHGETLKQVALAVGHRGGCSADLGSADALDENVRAVEVVLSETERRLTEAVGDRQVVGAQDAVGVVGAVERRLLSRDQPQSPLHVMPEQAQRLPGEGQTTGAGA